MVAINPLLQVEGFGNDGSSGDKMDVRLQNNGLGQNWFMPGATKEQMDWFNELQRMTASPENAARLRDVSTNIDVSDLLGQVSVPTLVMHCRDDGMVPFEGGRRMAAGIPGARFVALEGQNHLILEGDPAWPRFLAELTGFLALDDPPEGDPRG